MKTRKRLDGVVEPVTKEVEVSKLVSPSFLTLTKAPANQVSFKVVRDDKGETPMSANKTEVAPIHRRRIRSTQRSSLLFIEFPADATDEDVQAVADEYGLDGYEITVTASGNKCLKRNDIDEIPDNAVTVTTEDGKRLGVARADSSIAVPTPGSLPFINVVAIEFSKDKFADESATDAYLRRYDIDFLEKGAENTDKLIRVTRSEVDSDTEVRRVEVETGVVAVVTRAAVVDTSLPDTAFTQVVCEECYGNWGWGQLDFNASLADVLFCSAAEEAMHQLGRVIDRVLFYSELPVAARKDLVGRATTQFSEYIGALLDGLPAKVILVNRSNLDSTKESKVMTKKLTDASAKSVGDTTNGAQDNATKETTEQLTRADIAEMIAEGISTALKAKADEAKAEGGEGESTQRNDEVKGEEGDKADVSSVDSVASSVKELAELVTRSVKDITGSLDAMAKRVESVEGHTVLRSDDTDAGSSESKTKDVFAGVFGRRQ